MKNRKKKEAVTRWSEKQLTERRLAMERLHPGYIDKEFRLGTWLGLVMIGRLFLYGMNIILGVGRGFYIFLTPLAILVCFGFYSLCIRQNWIFAWMFLLFRIRELWQVFAKTWPGVFYLNFIGNVWWATTVAVVILDISFLAAVAFIPSVHRFVENEKAVYFGEPMGENGFLAQTDDSCYNGKVDEKM